MLEKVDEEDDLFLLNNVVILVRWQTTVAKELEATMAFGFCPGEIDGDLQLVLLKRLQHKLKKYMAPGVDVSLFLFTS